jgi:hypothetical protein
MVQSEFEATRGRSAPRRGSVATTARVAARSGEGATTGMDQRPRGRGAHGVLQKENGGRRGMGAWSRPAMVGGRGEEWGVWADLTKKGERAEPEETGGFFIYSNRIQTSLNSFDQKVDLPSSKNSK